MRQDSALIVACLLIRAAATNRSSGFRITRSALPRQAPLIIRNPLSTAVRQGEDNMEIPFYQIDAFANEVFSGNPAGVCMLDDWPQDEILQSIATENNLPETAFLVRQENGYDLRWFTPAVEIDLCGHATLASGHVIFEFVDRDSKRVDFSILPWRMKRPVQVTIKPVEC